MELLNINIYNIVLYSPISNEVSVDLLEIFGILSLLDAGAWNEM